MKSRRSCCRVHAHVQGCLGLLEEDERIRTHLGLTLMRGMVSTTVLLFPGPAEEVVIMRADICRGPPTSGKLVDACGPRMARAAASYALAASSSYSKKPKWFTCGVHW